MMLHQREKRTIIIAGVTRRLSVSAYFQNSDATNLRAPISLAVQSATLAGCHDAEEAVCRICLEGRTADLGAVSVNQQDAWHLFGCLFISYPLLGVQPLCLCHWCAQTMHPQVA